MLDGRTGGDVSKSIFVQGSSAGKIDSVSKIDSSCHINGNNGRSINSYFNK